MSLALLPACGLDHKRPAPDDDVGNLADQRDFADDRSLLEILDPAERSAAERDGLAPASADDPPASDSKSNTAGKLGIAILSVVLPLGAAVAPFFLF